MILFPGMENCFDNGISFYDNEYMNKLIYFFAVIFFSLPFILHAQKSGGLIYDGNQLYTGGNYGAAAEKYRAALKTDISNANALFNLGNALFKQKNFTEAEKYYAVLSKANAGDDLRSKAFYNLGSSLVSQAKLPEAAEAFKQSLLLNPKDEDTRENLQKVLNELKKKQNSAPQQNPKNKNPQPPKTSKEILEQKFEELRNQEKQLQKQLQKKNNTSQPEKDW